MLMYSSLTLCLGFLLIESAVSTSGSSCQCQQNGNTYEPQSADDCTTFLQISDNTGPIKQICPPGTKFDLDVCVCNIASLVTCPVNCGLNSCTCAAFGNFYQPISSDGCHSFNQYTDRANPGAGTIQNCPANTVFDPELCVCADPGSTTCESGCGMTVM